MKESHFIVDRIEGRSLVLQNRNAEIIIIDKTNVEDEVREGDILVKVHKNRYIVNKEETDNRKVMKQSLYQDEKVIKKLKTKRRDSFTNGLYQL